jgi:post-GPI attachment to proteins factor 3
MDTASDKLFVHTSLTRSSIYYSDTIWTEKLHFSSAAAFLGYSLIFAILRTSNLRDEASRVMVAAPILAFVTTHILYLNFYQLDKGKPGHDIF